MHNKNGKSESDSDDHENLKSSSSTNCKTVTSSTNPSLPAVTPSEGANPNANATAESTIGPRSGVEPSSSSSATIPNHAVQSLTAGIVELALPKPPLVRVNPPISPRLATSTDPNINNDEILTVTTSGPNPAGSIRNLIPEG